jgi:hypothetical protein
MDPEIKDPPAEAKKKTPSKASMRNARLVLEPMPSQPLTAPTVTAEPMEEIPSSVLCRAHFEIHDRVMREDILDVLMTRQPYVGMDRDAARELVDTRGQMISVTKPKAAESEAEAPSPAQAPTPATETTEPTPEEPEAVGPVGPVGAMGTVEAEAPVEEPAPTPQADPEPVAPVGGVGAMGGEAPPEEPATDPAKDEDDDAPAPLSRRQKAAINTFFAPTTGAHVDEDASEDASTDEAEAEPEEDEYDEFADFEVDGNDDFPKLSSLALWWLTKNRVVYRYDNRLEWNGGLSENPTYVERVAHRGLKLADVKWAIRVQARLQKIKVGGLDDIVHGWVKMQRDGRRGEIARAVFLPEGQVANPEPGFQALVDLAKVRFPDENPQFVAAVIEEVIWQIKRKMAKMQVKSPYLFAVYSQAQNAGKSTLCEDITSPLDDLRRKNVKVTMLTNGKNHQIWDYASLILDEMDQTPPTSIAALKNIITNEELNFRPFFTNANETVDNEVTLIGSANHRVIEMFGDPTGMRRYVEICHAERDIRFWPEALEVTNRLKPMWRDIWRNVDPERDSPIKERGFNDHLVQRQREMTPQGKLSPFEQWVAEFNPEDRRYIQRLGQDDHIKSGDLYEGFFVPAMKKLHVYPIPSKDAFGKQMGKMHREDPTGFPFTPKVKAAGTFYSYRPKPVEDEETGED